MSSFAPGTPREVMEEVNRRLYGATTDPKPYNPPANAPLAGSLGMKSLLGGLLGGQSQGNLNALLKILASNQQSSGSMADVPPRPETAKDPARGATGVGSSVMPEMSTPYQPPMKSSPPTGPYIPGFLGMPMPSSPQGPLPDISTMLPALPPMPPQMPIAGMTPAPTPPQMPSYTNPNQPPSGTAVPPQSQYGVPTSSDGKWLFNDGRWMPNSTAKTFPMPESRPEEVFPGPGQQTQGKGLDVKKLMDALRAMQGRRQGQGLPTQAPFVPDYMLPINQNTAAIDPNMPISDEQRKRNLEALMGGTPRMPQGREGTPRIGPSPTMRGSGMGLEGILQGIEASRRSSR